MTHIPNLANQLRAAGYSGRVHLVHGFNVSDGGAGTTDQFRDYYQADGFEVHEFDTKWRRGLIRDLLSVRFGNRKRAEKLAGQIEPGDILVGHSNGCALIHAASLILSALGQARSLVQIYHNPALDADTPASKNVSGRYVFHGRTDLTVRLASFLLNHEWGALGQIGYQEADPSKHDGVTQSISYDHLQLFKAGHSKAFAKPTSVQLMYSYHSRYLQHLIA